MGKIETIKGLLAKINMPYRQQNQLCCLALLAMAGVKEETPWSKATNQWTRIHDIMAFISSNYGITYAENSRETFRKQAMHPFRTAALIEDNAQATNSPNYRYRLTKEFLRVMRRLEDNTQENDDNLTLRRFLKKHDSLKSIYAARKNVRKMPVRINGKDFLFSPGKHNQLQKAIIEEFAPRFAPSAQCLYLGDTADKNMHKKAEKLFSLGLDITMHDKMPDVVLYREDRHWLYFVEAVTSVGPMNPKRILELQEMAKQSDAGKIFVTAFLDFDTFRKFSKQLAWETEVWIAEEPEHMIHLDGNSFIGPR